MPHVSFLGSLGIYRVAPGGSLLIVNHELYGPAFPVDVVSSGLYTL
jgi:hypothetical protein